MWILPYLYLLLPAFRAAPTRKGNRKKLDIALFPLLNLATECDHISLGKDRTIAADWVEAIEFPVVKMVSSQNNTSGIGYVSVSQKIDWEYHRSPSD